MKKNVLLLTIIAILSFSAFGQNKTFNELTFGLTALKPQVLPLEPIPFELTLTNNTDEAVTVETTLSFSGGSVSLEIKSPNGKNVAPSQASYLNGRVLIFPKVLSSGEKMESTQVFGFRIQDYFGGVGDYRVRATLNNKDGKKVRSDWVNLTITEPVGMEKGAYEYLSKKLKKHPNNYMPYVTWMPDELEEFVLKHPGTTYANYARYSLGEYYYEQDKEKAEEQFRQIQDSNFIYAQEVSEKLKKLESQKKN
jgi:hypothetical protein